MESFHQERNRFASQCRFRWMPPYGVIGSKIFNWVKVSSCYSWTAQPLFCGLVCDILLPFSIHLGTDAGHLLTRSCLWPSLTHEPNTTQELSYHCCMTENWLAWWRHQMETFSALLALCAGNSPVPVNSPHKGQWRGALMSSFIYAWINDEVNNREAGDLRRQDGHYDVIVMD